MWDAILGIGGDLLGGHLDNKWNQKMISKGWERDDARLQRLVVDAQKAGLSPLAALGSPAAGATATPLGATSSTGRSISRAMDRIQSKLQTENAELQNDLVRAQIANLNADTLRAGRIGNGQAGLDERMAFEVFNKQIMKSLGFSDAEEFEQRYGDVASALYGFLVLGADLAPEVRDLLFDPPEEIPERPHEKRPRVGPAGSPIIGKQGGGASVRRNF